MAKSSRGGKRARAKAPGNPFSGKGLEKLEELGGARWQKYGHDRLYLRNMSGSMGLEITRYNSGNISSAILNGERISNSRAARVLSTLNNAYIDIKGKRIIASGRDEDVEYIKNKIFDLSK